MRNPLLIIAFALLAPWLAPHPALGAVGRLDDSALPLPFPPSRAGGPYPYVIVTTRDLQLEFLRLANAHTREGLRAGIWSIESIRAAYPAGRDDAERIRMFLQDAHRELDTRWLLIGGDIRHVPIRVAPVRTGLPIPNDVVPMPTDQYYACLDGSWNADHDDTWGELDTDDVDCSPELIVGRAPVADAREARRFVDKTLDALPPKTRDASASKILLAAEVADFAQIDLSPFAEQLGVLFASLPGARITRLYENDAAWPGSQHETRHALIAELDRGYDLAVLWGAGVNYIFECGDPNEPHAPPGTENRYYDTDARAMANTHATIVCFASSYVCKPSPEIRSIGEIMAAGAQGEGASAVLGPTTLEFVVANDTFVHRVFDHAYELGARTIGEALTQTIEELGEPSDVTRLSTQGMILYGDPALPMNPPSQVQPGAAAAVHGQDALAAIPSTATLELRTPSVTADVASGGAEFSLRVVSSNPARGEARLVLSLPAALAAQRPEVGVYDLAGRQVRMLDGAKRSLSWDLKDETGSPVVPGIYFVNVRVASRTATRRITVMR